ncbi:MAG: sigma-54 factor interaction domain-containing protein [Bdellovibrionales bacterium]
MYGYSDTLLESELFGHVKGSFTGAVANKVGLFEEADGGTLFLDEIGDLDLSLQAKILRAIQEKSIKPVGSTKSKTVNVRIIAATHKDLKNEIKNERFREDLYYRLCVIPVDPAFAR